MSYDHRTVGFDKFDAFLLGLKTMGAPVALGIAGGYVITDSLAHSCYCDYDPEYTDSCPCCRGECDHIHQLRIAFFNDKSGELMVVKEWLELEDHDSGRDVVGIAIYQHGHRPELKTTVRESC